jgi:signal transduction histidine kinase
MSLDETRQAEDRDIIFHDVRTPLTIISLRVQLLTQKVDRGQPVDPDNLRRNLADMAEQVRLMQRVLARAESRSEARSGRPDKLVNQG